MYYVLLYSTMLKTRTFEYAWGGHGRLPSMTSCNETMDTEGHIYIYVERERDVYTYIHIYIYIYIHTDIHIYMYMYREGDMCIYIERER